MSDFYLAIMGWVTFFLKGFHRVHFFFFFLGPYNFPMAKLIFFIIETKNLVIHVCGLLVTCEAYR